MSRELREGLKTRTRVRRGPAPQETRSLPGTRGPGDTSDERHPFNVKHGHYGRQRNGHANSLEGGKWSEEIP